MMRLSVYTIDQNHQWDEIVKSFKNHDVYWLSGYVKAFQIHGDGEPLLFYYNDNETRGINVVMKRDVSKDPHLFGRIPQNQYFDFITPYGYGGWIIEGERKDTLFTEYEEWCHENGIICEFVRFHPVIDNHLHSIDYYNVFPLGQVITMDTSGPDVIWGNLTSKNRNMIRKAQKNGVEVYHAHNPESYQIFKEIYDGTMDKDHADPYYYFSNQFYESILKELQSNAEVFYAQYEGKVIAASIMLFENSRINYHLSGSIKEYSSLAPTNLILYATALWGNTHGYKSLYLGGGVGSSEDGLFSFKKSFYRKDDLKRFYIGKKTYNSEKYGELLNLREKMDTEFFPEYRA